MKALPTLFRLAAFAAAVLLLAGCPSGKIAQTRQQTLDQYEKVVRWSQWNGAVDFLAPEYLEENPVTRLDIERLELFRVTAYTVGQVAIGDDGMSVVQVVEIRMYNRTRAVERAVIDQQTWRYDAERERWYLHTGLPDVTRRY